MRCEQMIREHTKRARMPGAWLRAIASTTALLIAIAPIAEATQAPARPLTPAPTSASSPQSPAQGKQGTSTAPPQQPTSTPAQPLQPEGPSREADRDANAEWMPWTGGRYRITPADVIELRFPFVPEFDQTLSVQPDGHVSLREVGDLRVQGRTLPELRNDIREAYASIVREPVFTLVLKEFEKPYFVAAGQVVRPGRYDLRGATTLTQALAFAGGPNNAARMSEVVIFRHLTDETVSARQVNVKEMYSKRNLAEDPILRPGDTIFVPKSTLGKLDPILSRVSMGFYVNPVDFTR